MSTAAHARPRAPAAAGLVEDLAHFVRYPSVGADPRRRADVAACAAWLAQRLRKAGMPVVELVRTPGHPIVHAAWRGAPGMRTVLIYGHYDVQPAEPLAAWRTPPFTPVLRGEDLIGRGACDDKGPLLCHVLALERLLAASGRLPVNVVCVFEGEEEHGSPHLPAYLEAQRARLAPDVAVVSDTRMRGAGRPAIVDGTRGDLAVEVVLRRAGGDLHSGQFGGAVVDPARELCALVAHLHGPDREIAVPGFYDAVRPLAAAERARLAAQAPGAGELLRDAGLTDGAALAGERGYSAYERTTVRPALVVTALAAGDAGPGEKSAVPATARARLDLRLVPDQDPVVALALLRTRLRALAPAGLELTVRARGAGAAPATIDRRHPAMRAAVVALRDAFGREPVFLRSGGTVPIVDELRRRLGVPTVLMGFALPDGGMHAPNEKAHIPTLRCGAMACARFLELLGAASDRRAMRRPA
jgi:acetylornithine deacetylase/succinyl-diaminopimelate desuccinylase-like protein